MASNWLLASCANFRHDHSINDTASGVGGVGVRPAIRSPRRDVSVGSADSSLEMDLESLSRLEALPLASSWLDSVCRSTSRCSSSDCSLPRSCQDGPQGIRPAIAKRRVCLHRLECSASENISAEARSRLDMDGRHRPTCSFRVLPVGESQRVNFPSVLPREMAWYRCRTGGSLARPPNRLA
jgi:hypothetical protein